MAQTQRRANINDSFKPRHCISLIFSFVVKIGKKNQIASFPFALFHSLFNNNGLFASKRSDPRRFWITNNTIPFHLLPSFSRLINKTTSPLRRFALLLRNTISSPISISLLFVHSVLFSFQICFIVSISAISHSSRPLPFFSISVSVFF
jgi:hypothetical protein